MRWVLLAGIALLQDVHGFEWGWGSPSSKKHATDDLDPTSFPKFLKENPVTAILFYAPWCFYSQQVMPAWDTAAQKLMLHDPPVPLAKIDAHRYGSVGDKYGVNAFPTMKLFVDGAIFDYDSRGGRGWQQIVKWVNRHIDRDHVLSNAEDVEKYLHDNDLNVVGLFPDGHNSSTFGKSARHFDDVMFAEARGTQVSQDIAERLATHAMLACETVDVGHSSRSEKQVTLPRTGMHCSETPRNPQRGDWTDTFKVSITGTNLTVRRGDDPSGWQQHLQLKCCDNEEVGAKKEKVRIPVPSIVMFMPHDERFAVYDGDLEDIHGVDRWITARRTPMVMRLTPDTADKLLDAGPEKTPVLFFISANPQDAIEKVLREAAKLLRGRVLVCFTGMNSPIEKRLADVAGVEEDSGPVVTLIEAHAGTGPYHTARKFRLRTEGMEPQSVVQFITDYEQGRLQPWLRSEPEPAPEDMYPGTVGMLVGTTFTKTVQDTSKDVVVDFYAPWCGHCRKFEPHYKELAKKLKHVKSLRIMKLDATRNEVEGMSIVGFPTIVLFPAGQSPKRHITYQGNRQPDDMIRWLHDHCSIKFDERTPKVEQAQEDPVQSGLLDPSEEDL